MAEIYRDTVGKSITIGIPGAQVSKVEFYRGRNKVAEGTGSPAPIPYIITHHDGEFTTRWTYSLEGNTYVRDDVNTVVTPLFSAEELVDFNDTFSQLSDAKVIELERMVRGVIEAITGQNFGYREGAYTTYGNGDSILYTQERVISITSVDLGNYVAVPYTYNTVKNGFGIELAGGGWDGSEYESTGPIRRPWSIYPSAFETNVPYTINGAFGWASLPTEIKDAALLIAELFSCREASWRDRYLKTVSAADWRFDFDSRAFSGTGSVTADKLLEKFVVGRWAII